MVDSFLKWLIRSHSLEKLRRMGKIHLVKKTVSPSIFKLSLACVGALLFVSNSWAANNNYVTYEISRGGDGKAVVNWTISGGMTTSGVGYYPSSVGGAGFNGVLVNASGIFNGSYFNNNLLAVTSADGSQFASPDLGVTNSVSSYIAVHTSSTDSFGLTMASAFAASTDPNYSYNIQFTPGTGTVVLPVSFDAFNVGTYDTYYYPVSYAGGPYAGTVVATLNVVPEPSAASLFGLGIGALMVLRFRRNQPS